MVCCTNFYYDLLHCLLDNNYIEDCKLLKTKGIKIWIVFLKEKKYKNNKWSEIKIIVNVLDSKIIGKIGLH